MKYLILTFYYKPDLCAGSFRAQSFIDSLKEKINENDSIDIYTTMPNRYHSFEEYAEKMEKQANINIYRIELPKHKSGFIDQAKSFSKYYFTVLKKTKKNEYDKIFATSSRLFTAFLGAKLSRKKKIPLYLDIRDIFYDTLKSLFEKRISRYIFPFFVFKYIENYTFKYAKRLNLVSEGFKEYFYQFKDENSMSFFTNGIDKEFMKFIPANNKQDNIKKGIITYAGNIGEGQGLDWIVPQIAKRLEEKFIFRIIGDGGMKNNFMKNIKLYDITNIEILNPVNRTQLLEYYKKTDYFFLSLNNYPAFLKVLPSKIFEYGSLGKPGIAVLSGYSNEFIKKWLPNWLVLNHHELNSIDNNFLLDKIKNLNQFENLEFKEKFSRNLIMNKLAQDFLNIN